MPPNQDLDAGFLYVGVPARRARELADREKRFLQVFSGLHARTRRTGTAMLAGNRELEQVACEAVEQIPCATRSTSRYMVLCVEVVPPGASIR